MNAAIAGERSTANTIRNYIKSLSISDMFLILLTIIVAVLMLKASGANETTLYVYKDGVLWGSFPLSEERILEIDEHNTVQIKDHKAGIIEADCPDKRCVKQGFNSNMPIICLPNRLVLEFRSGKEEHMLILQ